MLNFYGNGELSVQIFTKSNEQKMSSSNIKVIIMPAAFQSEEIEDSDEIEILTKIIEFYKSAYYAYSANQSEMNALIDEVQSFRNNLTFPIDDALDPKSEYPVSNKRLTAKFNDIEKKIQTVSSTPIVTVKHTIEGTDIHCLNSVEKYTGLVTVQFYATAPYKAKDRWRIDGQMYDALMIDGSKPETGMFVSGACVSAIVNKDNQTINFKSGGAKITASYGSQTNFNVVTATKDKVLSGYQFYDNEGNLISGTAFPLNTNFISGDLLAGKTAYTQSGDYILGTLMSEKATAIPSSIAKGAFAYNEKGEKIEGINGGTYQIASGSFATPISAIDEISVHIGFIPKYIMAVSYSNYFGAGYYGIPVSGIDSKNAWVGGNVNNYQTPLAVKEVFTPTVDGFTVSFKEINMIASETAINKNWYTYYGGKIASFVAFG